MKTALQILKDRLLVDKSTFPNLNEHINGVLKDINNELLEEEKEHIIQAHKQGASDMATEEDFSFDDSEKYYSETYENLTSK